MHFQRFSHLTAIFNCFSSALSAVFALDYCLLCFPVLTGVHLHGPVWSKMAVFAHTLSSLCTCMSIQPQKEGEQKVKVDLDMECEEGRPSRGTPLRFAPFRPLPLSPAFPLRGNLYPTGPSPYPCAGVHKPPEGSPSLRPKTRIKNGANSLLSQPLKHYLSLSNHECRGFGR